MSQQSSTKILPLPPKVGLSGAVESFLKNYFAAHDGDLRSEERRVGKECRL